MTARVNAMNYVEKFFCVLVFRFRYSFICQGTSTRRQWRPFRSSESICHLLLPV